MSDEEVNVGLNPNVRAANDYAVWEKVA